MVWGGASTRLSKSSDESDMVMSQCHRPRFTAAVGACPLGPAARMEELPGWLAAIERGQLTEAAAAQLCARLLQPAAGCVGGGGGPRARAHVGTCGARG